MTDGRSDDNTPALLLLLGELKVTAFIATLKWGL